MEVSCPSSWRNHTRAVSADEGAPSSMPLVVISGQPCSGKSQTAAELAGVLRDAGHQVVVVSDESVGVSRCEAYKGRQGGATRPSMRAWIAASCEAAVAHVFSCVCTLLLLA